MRRNLPKDGEIARLLGKLRTDEGKRSLIAALETRATGLEKAKDYPKAAAIWVELGAKNWVERCIKACEKAKRYEDAARICEISGQDLRAADYLVRAGLYSQAAYIHDAKLNDRSTAEALRRASDIIYGDGSG